MTPREVLSRVLNWCFGVSMPGTVRSRLEGSQPLGNVLMSHEVSGRLRTYQRCRAPPSTARTTYPSELSGSPSKGLARTVDWSGDRCARTRLFTLRRVNGGFGMLDESSKIRHRCPTDRITRPALLVAIHVTTLGGSPVPPSGAALNPLLIGPSAQSRQPPACSPAVQTPQRRA